jgi:EpsD family peptidyl-prolyl cis-trans isomerase
MLSMRFSRLQMAALAICVISIFSWCGARAVAAPTPTQVVARVDGRELTISQLNHVLLEMHAPDSGPAAQQEALNRLIDEELMVQAAQTAKLDRDPTVMMSMEDESREILVRAYAERHIFPSAQIEESELHKFYDDNPALFSARKIYQAVVFNVEQAPLAAGAQAALNEAHSPDAVRAILLRNSINFQTEAIKRAAEAIPLPMLPTLAGAKVGDIVVAPSGVGRTQLLLLNGLESSPLSFEQVSGEIGEFLTTQRNREALKAAVRQLQIASKIEYISAQPAAASTP